MHVVASQYGYYLRILPGPPRRVQVWEWEGCCHYIDDGDVEPMFDVRDPKMAIT